MGYDEITKECYNCKFVSEYWFQGQCVDAIPIGTALKVEEFAAYVICNQMDPPLYIYEDKCLKTCPANTRKYPQQLKCSIDNCKDYDAFIYNTLCVSNCPYGTTLNLLCVNDVQIYSNILIINV